MTQTLDMMAQIEGMGFFEALIGYREDPIGFAIDVLGMREDYIWHKMVEVCEAVRDHRKVAIRAGHSVSKTYTMGRIVVPWFKSCFQPSTVLTTAPSETLVKDQMWREIRSSLAGARRDLGGKIHTTSWDVKPSQKTLDTLEPEDRPNWEKNFAIGLSTSPDTTSEHATKIHGFHNEYVLVVIDEACGILPAIWRTIMEGLLTDSQAKVVAIGNPTDPESEFAKCCYSSDEDLNEGKEPYISDKGWYVITIDARDNPNYIAKERLIPGLYDYESVQDIMKEYGADGDGTRYRVKGLFPNHKEGTFYGDKVFEARRDNRVGEFPHMSHYPVYTFSDYGDMYTATIFVQFVQGMVRIIDDYWDYEGAGAPEWANVCNAKKYKYDGHIAGPDLNPMTGSNKKSFATGTLLKNTLLKLGFDVTPCEYHDFNSGIRLGRELWPLLQVNDSCETFLKASSGYCKMKNIRLSTEHHPVYHDNPAKTWHRHIMDAFRHLAVMYRIHQYKGDTLEGLYDYKAMGEGACDPYENNVLDFGGRYGR
jgi:hypothetical protein